MRTISLSRFCSGGIHMIKIKTVKLFIFTIYFKSIYTDNILQIQNFE